MAKENKRKWEQQPDESGAAQEAPPANAELIEFEGWFASREAQIPKHHHQEVLRADFKGQGVPEMATPAQWDAALKKYGVVLG